MHLYALLYRYISMHMQLIYVLKERCIEIPCSGLRRRFGHLFHHFAPQYIEEAAVVAFVRNRLEVEARLLRRRLRRRLASVP